MVGPFKKASFILLLLIYFKPTNAHNYIRVLEKTQSPTYFGPYWPIIREDKKL